MWFDFEKSDTKVDRVLNAMPAQQYWSYKEMIAYTIAEHHLWLSVIMRPMRSNFTRVQRLSCLLSLVFITMSVITMSLKTTDNIQNMSQIVIGHFRFSRENIEMAMLSLFISTIIISIVTFFFKNSETEESQRFESTLLNAYRKANAKAHFDKSVLGRFFYPPAENALYYTHYFLPKYCVYIGWTVLATSVVVLTFFISTYTDTWELIQSEKWMTTVLVAFIFSVLTIEVLKVRQLFHYSIGYM